MEYYNVFKTISVYPHHIKQSVCGSRANYRDGKKETAVKVYTVNRESVYIVIINVPAIGGSEELQALCDQYGIVEEFRSVDEYPCEEFTEAFLVKYNSFPAARSAKRYLDDKSFLGGILHVFYAPEFESVQETRMKLQERRKYVAWKTKNGQNISTNQKTSVPHSTNNNSVKPTSAAGNSSIQPVTYIWAGKEYTTYNNVSSVQKPIIEDKAKGKITSGVFLPRQVKKNPSDCSNYSSSTYQAQGASTSNVNLSQVDETSYLNTISSVRTKISKVSVPNVRVSLKRRRRV